MNKISIGDTIVRGYGFTARRIVGNLGLSWLGAVFYAVAAAYWLHQFCTTLLVSPHSGGELNDFALFDIFGFVVTMALGSAVIARPLTGVALEPGGETMTAYFAVAKREWLLFVALLRLYAFVIAAGFAVVLLGGLLVSLASPMVGHAQWQGVSALTAMNVAVALVAFAVVGTLVVRLGFFAAAIASNEDSMSMTRAWSISGGNSWRIFVVALGLSVPALLLWAAAEWALIGSDLTGAVTAVLSSSHDSTPLCQLINDNALAVAGVWSALIIVLNMLFAGASAPAYLTVRDNAASRQVRSVPTAPVLEPVFAGSFAGFATREAKSPVTHEADAVVHAEAAPETFVATPESEAVEATEIPVETHVLDHALVTPPVDETAVDVATAEPEAALPVEDDAGVLPVEMAHVEAALAPVQDEHEQMVLADEVHHDDAHDVMQLTNADETAIAAAPAVEAEVAPEAEAAHVETAPAELHAHEDDATPRPSHDGELELSQQNAPSEAA